MKTTKRESAIQDEIRLALQLRFPELVLWRNNTGQIGAVKFGLCKGSADLIGIVPYDNEESDCLIGRFVAIECKAENGKVSPEQLQFLKLARSKGAIAFIARSAEQAIASLLEQL